MKYVKTILLLCIGFKIPLWNNWNHFPTSRQPCVCECSSLSQNLHQAGVSGVTGALLHTDTKPEPHQCHLASCLQSSPSQIHIFSPVPEFSPSSTLSLRCHFLSSLGAVSTLWVKGHSWSNSPCLHLVSFYPAQGYGWCYFCSHRWAL